MTEPGADGGARPGRRKHGCLFYSGIVLLGIVLVGVVGGYLGLRYVVHRLVDSYTSTSPAVFPPTRLSANEAGDLRRRISEFAAALADAKPTPPLVLSANEINASIAGNAGWRELGAATYISIDGDRIAGEVSGRSLSHLR